MLFLLLVDLHLFFFQQHCPMLKKQRLKSHSVQQSQLLQHKSRWRGRASDIDCSKQASHFHWSVMLFLVQYSKPRQECCICWPAQVQVMSGGYGQRSGYARSKKKKKKLILSVSPHGPSFQACNVKNKYWGFSCQKSYASISIYLLGWYWCQDNI